MILGVKVLHYDAVVFVYSKMLNKNTWGVNKVRGQEEPVTKSSDIK